MPVKLNLRGAILIVCLTGTPVALRSAQAAGSQPQLPASAGGSLLGKADAAYHAGRLDEARRWLEQAIQNDPRSARAHALLGLVWRGRMTLRGRSKTCGKPMKLNRVIPTTPTITRSSFFRSDSSRRPFPYLKHCTRSLPGVTTFW